MIYTRKLISSRQREGPYKPASKVSGRMPSVDVKDLRTFFPNRHASSQLNPSLTVVTPISVPTTGRPHHPPFSPPNSLPLPALSSHQADATPMDHSPCCAVVRFLSASRSLVHCSSTIVFADVAYFNLATTSSCSSRALPHPTSAISPTESLVIVVETGRGSQPLVQCVLRLRSAFLHGVGVNQAPV
jgi:hypothetical protein